MINNSPTMQKTLESIIETQQIADNIWAAVSSGEITQDQATELIDSFLS